MYTHDGRHLVLPAMPIHTADYDHARGAPQTGQARRFVTQHVRHDFFSSPAAEWWRVLEALIDDTAKRIDVGLGAERRSIGGRCWVIAEHC